MARVFPYLLPVVISAAFLYQVRVGAGLPVTEHGSDWTVPKSTSYTGFIRPANPGGSKNNIKFYVTQ